MRAPKTSPMSAPKHPEITFEQAMERLDEIVSAMESDRMPLDEMVSSYEEGTQLLQLCTQRIDKARQRIEVISLKAGGEAELTPFDPAKAAESPESPTRTPSRRRPPSTEAGSSDDIRLF